MNDQRDVYFIGAENGLIKIGVAGNPSDRIQELRTGSPVRLLLLGVIRGAGAAGERTLHEWFDPWRKHGEWFAANPALVGYIRTHAYNSEDPGARARYLDGVVKAYARWVDSVAIGAQDDIFQFAQYERYAGRKYPEEYWDISKKIGELSPETQEWIKTQEHLESYAEDERARSNGRVQA